MGSALHLNGDASRAVGKWKLALMYLSSPGKACDGSERAVEVAIVCAVP